MLRFYNNSYSERIKGFFDCVHDLDGKAFLYLESSRVHINNTCKFAEAGDPSVGNVCDMGLAEERKDVVLAHAEEFDILHENHFANRFVKLRGVENCSCVEVIALGHVLHGLSEPLGSFF